jgi:hypothetical protein
MEEEENGSETLEEAEPTSTQTEEATSGLPEDTSSQSDGKRWDM